jgi:hypothetical protein
MRNKALTLIVLIILSGCSSGSVDPVTGERVRIEPNVEKRAREAADKGGGIFGDINNIGKDLKTTYSFASSNPLWRATLKTLDFLPLINADYSGGIIIYDWYSENPNSNEQIKISVRFLSSELRSNSFEITTHKKKCDDLGKCFITKTDNKFSNEIKDTIITTARSISIEEKKKELK